VKKKDLRCRDCRFYCVVGSFDIDGLGFCENPARSGKEVVTDDYDCDHIEPVQPEEN